MLATVSTFLIFLGCAIGSSWGLLSVPAQFLDRKVMKIAISITKKISIAITKITTMNMLPMFNIWPVISKFS